MSELRFDGRVAIVTGAGMGIGKEVALELARRGARVIVNDFGVSMDGGTFLQERIADKVVAEIRANGGEAFANYESVLNGHSIINDAIKIWGRVDIVINNAGFLRDKAFHKMEDKDFDLVHGVHVKGNFMVTRAAWPYMRSQKYGRIINMASVAGIFGNFGQANYASAKLGVHGLTNTLAKEGQSKGIFVNTIAPLASTRMTESVLPGELFSAVNTKTLLGIFVYLSHESSSHTGGLYEVGGGWFSKLRWQRTQGVLFDFPLTAEHIADKFEEVCDFTNNPEYPTTGNDSIMKMYENYERNQKLIANQAGADSLKANEIFDLIHNFLIKEGAHAVKVCNSLYNFEITKTKKGPVIKTWGVDLKNGNGQVALKPFGKPNATFRMSDENFYKVCMGQLNPQIAFLQGKMKIKGNMKSATVFTPELFPKPTPENFAKYQGAKL